MLVLLLSYHREDPTNWRKRIHEKDLGAHNRETIIKSLEKPDYEISLVVGFCRASANRNGLEII
jgi:CO dehydrogenase/acetyl-CoA synthase alpha subunit